MKKDKEHDLIFYAEGSKNKFYVYYSYVLDNLVTLANKPLKNEVYYLALDDEIFCDLTYIGEL